MIDLDKLLELEAKATPGPWTWRKFGNEEVLVCDEKDRKIVISGGYTRNERGFLEPMKPEHPVSDLIPAMRNSIRELCLELKAAREVAEASRKATNPHLLEAVADAARNYFTEHDLEGLSKNYFKDYHAVKRALENLDEARRE